MIILSALKPLFETAPASQLTFVGYEYLLSAWLYLAQPPTTVHPKPSALTHLFVVSATRPVRHCTGNCTSAARERDITCAVAGLPFTAQPHLPCPSNEKAFFRRPLETNTALEFAID
ncbi:hypothetical protein PMIN07_006123 [Paraphaeosphaeria minitans]